MSLRRWFDGTKKTLLFFLAITPLIFSPLPGIHSEFMKLCWITGVGGIALLLTTFRMIQTRNVELSFTPGIIGWSVSAIAAFLSLLVVSGNKIEALLSPVGAVTLLAGCCMLLFFSPLLTKKDTHFFTNVFLTVATLLSVITIYQQLGVTKSIFPTATQFQDPLWSPLGTPITALWFFTFTLPFLIRMGLRAKYGKNETNVALSGVSILLTLLAIVLVSIKLFPNISSYILPIPTGVRAVTSAFSSPLHMFFGVGAENFLPLFTSIRPVSFNMLPIWTIGFDVNSTLFLHIGSIFGIVGIVGFILVILTTIQTLPASRFSTLWSIFLFFLLIVSPPSIMVYFILIVLFLMMKNDEEQIALSANPALRYSLCIILSIFSITFLYAAGRACAAEYHFAQSRKAGEAGNGSGTFISQQQAINDNPFVSTYHIGLSRTATALAGALITATESDANGVLKLPESDQTTVKELVSVAIRQGKLAVTLAPKNVLTWSTLAQTYQQLVGVATDADTWAVASFQKAINLDPTNPILERDLGMLYTNLGRYDEAHEAFVKAVQLKPDYANAFYSMAHMFIKKGDVGNAKKALEETLLLVKNDGKATETILQQLKDLSNGVTPLATPTPGMSDDRPPLIP